MTKHGTLKKRIIDTITNLYEYNDVLDSKTEFQLDIYPFNSKAFWILIQKYKNVDFIKITSVVVLNSKIQKSILDLPGEQKNQVIDQFTNVYFEHRKTLTTNETLDSLQSMTFLTIHNISMQRILDEINNEVLLIRDIAKHLSVIDTNVKSEPMNNNHTMFQ